jgi:hypothetical protein
VNNREGEREVEMIRWMKSQIEIQERIGGRKDTEESVILRWKKN